MQIKAHFVVTIKNTMLQAFTFKQGLKRRCAGDSQLVPAHKKANFVNFFSTLHSAMSSWYVEMDHGGSIYTTEIGKSYKSGLCSSRCLPTHPYLKEQILNDHRVIPQKTF